MNANDIILSAVSGQKTAVAYYNSVPHGHVGRVAERSHDAGSRRQS